MNVSVVIASYGADRWAELAEARACPSACAEEPHEVIVLHGEGSTTLAQTRNEGARRATGEWLLFLDADDELQPGFLREMRAIVEGDPAIATRWISALLTPAVEYRVRSRPGRPPRQAGAPRVWPRKPLREGNWLVIGTLLPRELFERVGGFREWPLYEDWCLWQRCELAGAEIVEAPRAVYIAHSDPTSRNRAPARRVKLATHRAIVEANYGPSV